MSRYALVRDSVVVNLTVWDGETPWGDSEHAVALPDDSPVGEGWRWEGGDVFTPPADPPAPMKSIEARLADLERDVAELKR